MTNAPRRLSRFGRSIKATRRDFDDTRFSGGDGRNVRLRRVLKREHVVALRHYDEAIIEEALEEALED